MLIKVMEEKEIKIETPQGYEIDKEKSTFEKIVFKKVDSFDRLPKTWEEYCKRTKDYVSYFWSSPSSIIKSWFEGSYNEFVTEERVQQYVTLGKLLQLRDYWVGDWKPEPGKTLAIVFNNEDKGIRVITSLCLSYPLTFPTKEMAKKFKECFEDLIRQAYPLV